MKIVKTTYQDTNVAYETAYIIKGFFKKKYYRLDVVGVIELPIKGLKDV